MPTQCNSGSRMAGHYIIGHYGAVNNPGDLWAPLITCHVNTYTQCKLWYTTHCTHTSYYTKYTTQLTAGDQ